MADRQLVVRRQLLSEAQDARHKTMVASGFHTAVLTMPMICGIAFRPFSNQNAVKKQLARLVCTEIKFQKTIHSRDKPSIICHIGCFRA